MDLIEQTMVGLDGWVLGVLVLASLLVSAEAGYRISRRYRSTQDDVGRSQVSAIQGAVLGLLALLLGFTFSMAATRFDTRKQLVLEESNAIGTANLRAQLLPEPHRTRVLALMHRYVDTRLQFFAESRTPEGLVAVNAATDRLHEQLWREAVGAGEKDPRAVTTGLFIAALNDVIDLHSKQVTAVRNRIPLPIFLLLWLVAIAALGLVGYASGAGASRNALLTVVTSVLVTAVILLIIDLHRPTRGMVTVSPQNMIDLRDSLQRAPP